MYISNRMIGRIKQGLRRLTWRHLLWTLIMAGAAYGCLPFFYAASYTWTLLHPACMPEALEAFDGKLIQITDDSYGDVQFWYMPPQNDRVLILVGGRGGTLGDWQNEIQIFQENGFGLAILADPSCAHLPASLGYQEKEQIIAVAHYLSVKEDVGWIGAAGFSAGASALALAMPQTEEIHSAIFMGNFADLKSEILYTSYPFASFGWIGQRAVLFWYGVFSGNTARQVNPMHAFESYAKQDILLIHGEYEAERTHAAAQLAVLRGNRNVSAALWIIPQAGHGMYQNAAPEEYLNRLLVFFSK